MCSHVAALPCVLSPILALCFVFVGVCVCVWGWVCVCVLFFNRKILEKMGCEVAQKRKERWTINTLEKEFALLIL